MSPCSAAANRPYSATEILIGLGAFVVNCRRLLRSHHQPVLPLQRTKESFLKPRRGIVSAIVFGALLTIFAAAQAGPQAVPFSADLQASSSRGGDVPHDVTGKLYFTGGRIRMDLQGEGHGGVIIMTNARTSTSDMLMPAQHIYMEFKITPTTHQPGMAPNIKPFRDPSDPCADARGTTCKKMGVEQVNGRTCDHWVVTRKDGNVSNVWVDQKLRFPIKTVTREDTWQLTNIVEGEPAASLFVIPPDYRKIDLSGMPPGKHSPAQ